MIRARRLMSTCPFCHAATTSDRPEARRYACGTKGYKGTGVYKRRCK
jgi:hypothetical protein